jgi:hypothetical protein
MDWSPDLGYEVNPFSGGFSNAEFVIAAWSLAREIGDDRIRTIDFGNQSREVECGLER